MEDNNKPKTHDITISDPDIETFEIEKESGIEYRKRRQPDWNDNYTLYRDKVITNRLTQRQTINIPLMKYGLNTLLKDIDEPPMLHFANLDNDQQKEIFYNEHWKEVSNRTKLKIKDIVDKKQAMLYGRTFKKLNIVDGRIAIELVDPQDMVVHMYVDPTDMDTAPCLIQTGIYRTLRSVLKNEEYDKEARRQLKNYFSQDSTDLEQDTTYESALDKAQRLSDMGHPDVMSPLLGEKYIELNEVYRYEEDKDKGNIIHMMVVAATDGGSFKLSKKPLCDVIGKTEDNYWYNHFPYSSWATDPEATDFWSDGIADILRNINRVLNAWISQLVENRTLRNFGMTFYDSSNAEFVPQTFTPMPFGFYPVPGNPNEVMQPVVIPDLSESLDEMQFLIGMAEKATAATSANTGATEERQVTLGEVQLALSNAKERVQSMKTYYTESWKDFGERYVKMLEAADDLLDPMVISRRGRLGKKMYKREITAENWRSKSGYTTEIKTKEDHEAESVQQVQKLQILAGEMPDNLPLIEIKNKKLMEFAGLTPDEMMRVEEFEKQKMMMPQAPMGMEGAMPAEGAPTGGIPDVPDLVGAGVEQPMQA